MVELCKNHLAYVHSSNFSFSSVELLQFMQHNGTAVFLAPKCVYYFEVVGVCSVVIVIWVDSPWTSMM